jgi:hypothetical protein
MHSIIAYSNKKKLKYYDTIIVEYLLKRERGNFRVVKSWANY